jgi:hypothetical protein
MYDLRNPELTKKYQEIFKKIIQDLLDKTKQLVTDKKMKLEDIPNECSFNLLRETLLYLAANCHFDNAFCKYDHCEDFLRFGKISLDMDGGFLIELTENNRYLKATINSKRKYNLIQFQEKYSMNHLYYFSIQGFDSNVRNFFKEKEIVFRQSIV